MAFYSNCIFFYDSENFIIYHFIFLHLQIWKVEKNKTFGDQFFESKQIRNWQNSGFLTTYWPDWYHFLSLGELCSFIFIFLHRLSLVGNVETIYHK